MLPAVGEEPAAPEAEDGAELPPAEAVSHAEAEVQHYEAVIAAGKATVTNAAAVLDLEKQALAAVVKVRGAVGHAGETAQNVIPGLGASLSPRLQQLS